MDSYQLLAIEPGSTELSQISLPTQGDSREEVVGATLLAYLAPDTKPETLRQSLASYLAAFTPNEQTSFVLVSTDPQDAFRVSEQFEAACRSHGLDPENTADVVFQVVKPDQLQAVFLGQLLSARAVLTLSVSPEARELARSAEQRGFELHSEPSVETLRRVIFQGRRVPAKPPAPRLFLAMPDWGQRQGWREIVEAFVQGFKPDEPIELRIWVDPRGNLDITDAGSLIIAHMQALGFDPENCATLELFDAEPRTKTLEDFFAGITAFVSDGEPIREALAAHHGIPVIYASQMTSEAVKSTV
jgi:hypothetical protein